MLGESESLVFSEGLICVIASPIVSSRCHFYELFNRQLVVEESGCFVVPLTRI